MRLLLLVTVTGMLRGRAPIKLLRLLLLEIVGRIDILVSAVVDRVRRRLHFSAADAVCFAKMLRAVMEGSRMVRLSRQEVDETSICLM